MHGHHMQFLAKRESVLKFLPDCNNKMMKTAASPWNKAIDAAGLLQITTSDRVCRHIGNILDESIIEDSRKMGLL